MKKIVLSLIETTKIPYAHSIVTMRIKALVDTESIQKGTTLHYRRPSSNTETARDKIQKRRSKNRNKSLHSYRLFKCKQIQDTGQMNCFFFF